MHKILFICHGNICRSTMAQFVMQYLVDRAGRTKDFFIDSAGVSREEIGNGVDFRTVRTLQNHGIPCGKHFARQITKRDYENFDYLVAMDENNLWAMKRFYGQDEKNKFYKMTQFALNIEDWIDSPNVADPWYTGDFETTFDVIWENCQAFFEKLTTGPRV